ncbi:exodeoxyribonuclease VII small subunit [Bacillus sp. AGMB 02131]|uniref:Exodeoxyribonuclease 7 small subunit n=1 Tax=Peribacillus faecalis TaxID=2772559 RepID=A0A927CV04_9BACI|nr:exodeoxyribonuclease VII small subunit [Peribacillus faecalis]MBD3108088.1 exodeoxyribonuclease VII small subunit [Peribacillus faecalis]
MSKENELTFEEAMEQLEHIVELLEEGDVPLEEAITIYKKGMDLSKICHGKLAAAQEQLVQILDENGELKPFQVKEED